MTIGMGHLFDGFGDERRALDDVRSVLGQRREQVGEPTHVVSRMEVEHELHLGTRAHRGEGLGELREERRIDAPQRGAELRIHDQARIGALRVAEGVLGEPDREPLGEPLVTRSFRATEENHHPSPRLDAELDHLAREHVIASVTRRAERFPLVPERGDLAAREAHHPFDQCVRKHLGEQRLFSREVPINVARRDRRSLRHTSHPDRRDPFFRKELLRRRDNPSPHVFFGSLSHPKSERTIRFSREQPLAPQNEICTVLFKVESNPPTAAGGLES